MGLTKVRALRAARRRARKDFRGFTYNRRTGWATLTAFLLMMIAAGQALAEGPTLGVDCTIIVDVPTACADGSTETALCPADGYTLVYGPAPSDRSLSTDLGNATQATCAAIGLQAGQYYMAVRARNAAGEGPESTEVPFVFVAVKLPGAPVLRVTP